MCGVWCGVVWCGWEEITGIFHRINCQTFSLRVRSWKCSAGSFYNEMSGRYKYIIEKEEKKTINGLPRKIVEHFGTIKFISKRNIEATYYKNYLGKKDF